MVARILREPAAREAYEDRLFVHAVARAVRTLREEAKMTQSKLAALAGTTQPVIARLESANDTRAPRFELLERIAAAFGRGCKLVFTTKAPRAAIEIESMARKAS